MEHLESKLVASMEYHVDTNKTLNSLKQQMDSRMQTMSQLARVTQPSDAQPAGMVPVTLPMDDPENITRTLRISRTRLPHNVTL